MVAQEIRDIVSRYVAALENHGIHVYKALIYGSVAENRGTVDSDLDIAVISSDFGHDRYGEGKLLNQVAWRIDARIHPVPVSSNSYDNETWIPLIYEIRKHGVEVS
jgi:predicted nucleotidyltransferase